MELHSLLEQACELLGIPTTGHHEEKIQQFLELLQKWNQVYNLTAITDPQEILIKHVFDSLSVLPHLSDGYVADVGTGAGFPGIPLAIYQTDQRFDLIDSNGKKTRFLQHAVAQLKLNNVKVDCERVEQWQPSERFDVILARAFAPIEKILKWTEHLLTDRGQWLLMSGKILESELSKLDDTMLGVQIIPVTVPFLNAERHLIRIQRRGTD
jgi:16S rRNA (guanine527-N7)-methyltransferase